MVDFPEHDSHLVLNCKFGADSSWKVSLSRSLSILDTTSIVAVNNAQINIFEEGNLVETLNESNRVKDGVYRLRNRFPLSGLAYTIEASAPGFDDVNAIDTIPNKTDVENVESLVTSQAISGTNVEYESIRAEAKIKVRVLFDDPVAETNYYALSIYRIDTVYEYGGSNWEVDSSSFSYYTDFMHLTPIGVEAPSSNVVLFTDELFNGERKEVIVDLNYSGTTTHDKLYIRFSAISKAYYLYEKSFSDYIDKKDLPFSEPVQIYNNIESGFGIFAGRSNHLDSILLHFEE